MRISTLVAEPAGFVVLPIEAGLRVVMIALAAFLEPALEVGLTNLPLAIGKNNPGCGAHLDLAKMTWLPSLACPLFWSPRAMVVRKGESDPFGQEPCDTQDPQTLFPSSQESPPSPPEATDTLLPDTFRCNASKASILLSCSMCSMCFRSADNNHLQFLSA